MRRTAALIIGGGPAGSAAAITLARGGASPELIERAASPHDVVCGGFLGWDALAALGRLGVDAAALGGQPIHRLRLVAGERKVEVDLPKRAMGLSRRTLDEALLRAANETGATVTRGRAARAVDPETRAVRLSDGEEIVPDALFLATGKHELRGLARPLEGRAQALSIGLRTTLPGSSRMLKSLNGIIELNLFEGGYAGLLLQEDGDVNLCLSVSRCRMNAAGNPAALIEQNALEAPHLAELLTAIPALSWDAVAGIPYGWRSRATGDGIFRLGDQSAVIASLAGDGIAIALTSGILAANALLRHGPEDARVYQAAFARRAARPLAIAEALRHAAEDGRLRPALITMARMPGLARLAARATRIA